MPSAVSHSNFPPLELRDCLQSHTDCVQPEGQPKARPTGSDLGISAPRRGPLGGQGGCSWGGGVRTRWFLRCGPSLSGDLLGFHLIVHGQPPGPLSLSEPLGTFLFELERGRYGFFVCKQEPRLTDTNWTWMNTEKGAEHSRERKEHLQGSAPVLGSGKTEQGERLSVQSPKGTWSSRFPTDCSVPVTLP